MRKITHFIKGMNKNGQGLIEVIVSIAIIITGILGALTLATVSIRSGTESREKVQASLLVQEGIEVVKNIRDTNWIKTNDSTGWTTFKDNALANSGLHIISYNTTDSAWELKDGAEETLTDFSNFKRKIQITEKDANKLEVSCTISWPGGSITALEYITNWKN